MEYVDRKTGLVLTPSHWTTEERVADLELWHVLFDRTLDETGDHERALSRANSFEARRIEEFEARSR